jgi:hypothetical protein
MEVEPWARRTNAAIALATAPTLAVNPLMLTIHQVPSVLSGWTMPSSRFATTLYLVLLLAFVALISTVIWGYSSLSNGLLTRGKNGHGLRAMATVPGFLAGLVVVVAIVSVVIEPHRYVTHGNAPVPLNGHPLAAHVLWVAAGATICLCWLASVVLLGWVARRAELPLPSLHSGTRISIAISVLLWTMSAAALCLSAVHLKRISELSGITIQSVAFGQSLFVLGTVLCALSIASTLGSVLTFRSWKVTSHLAR